MYGITLILMYAVSTVYHALPQCGVKRILRIMDHNAIYLLIAGTYTPIVLNAVRGTLGWVIFGVIWAAAIFGIVMTSVALKGSESFQLYAMSLWAGA